MATRGSAATVLACIAVLFALVVHAEDISVPISLQVDLLGKVLWYERSLQRATSKSVSVLILTRADHLESAAAAEQLEAQLARAKNLGGKTLTVKRTVYQTTEQTKQTITGSGSYLLYLTPGLEGVIKDLAAALQGTTVLTVSPFGSGVELGAVLGFELASSKPRIALNLGRARAQKLEFSAQFLRIARVVQ